MVFKEGDKVVCIKEKETSNELVLNKQYTIKKGFAFAEKTRVRLIEMDYRTFFAYRFKLLSEVRKEKLKQLRNGI